MLLKSKVSRVIFAAIVQCFPLPITVGSRKQRVMASAAEQFWMRESHSIAATDEQSGLIFSR